MDASDSSRKRRRLSASTSNNNTSDIIDLTGDFPPPTTARDNSSMHPYQQNGDEALAKQLQAQFDGEEDAQPPAAAAISSPSSFFGHHEPHVITTNEVQAAVRGLALIQLKCACGKNLLHSESEILTYGLSLTKSIDTSTFGIVCPGSCGQVTFHEQLPVIKIWAVLSFFDAKSKHNEPSKPSKTDKKPESSVALGRYGGSNGIGYGGGHRGPFGMQTSGDFDEDDEYFDHLGSSSRHPFKTPGRTLGDTQPPTKPQSKDGDDTMTTNTINWLAKVLPLVREGGKFDSYSSVKLLQSLFLCSSILERAADLLRNNDLEDVTRRLELYKSLLGLVQTLAEHPSTSPLVFGERVMRSAGTSILQVSLDKANLVESKESDTTQPLTRCMQELAVQAKMMLNCATVHPVEGALFQSITGLNDFFIANSVSSESKSESATKNAWHKELAVADLADEAITKDHSKAPKESGGLNGYSAPGRMRRIMKDIATLRTSLPDGIFVRYCSSRPDAMKFLIIGPEGTPYENGLFEFDLLCGPEFPLKPPEVQFRTTGGGRVYFNPNLYSDGKVCLSLLGTWAGEPWDPKQSTLLQIVISIQAMIFCEKPYENEPGQENGPEEQVKTYNRGLYPHTIQHGMLDWLEKRKYQVSSSKPGVYEAHLPQAQQTGDSIWDEIVKQHFEDSAENIVKTVIKWVSEKPTPPVRRSRQSIAQGGPSPFPSNYTMPTPDPSSNVHGFGKLGYMPSPGWGQMGYPAPSAFKNPLSSPGHTLGGAPETAATSGEPASGSASQGSSLPPGQYTKPWLPSQYPTSKSLAPWKKGKSSKTQLPSSLFSGSGSTLGGGSLPAVPSLPAAPSPPASSSLYTGSGSAPGGGISAPSSALSGPSLQPPSAAPPLPPTPAVPSLAAAESLFSGAGGSSAAPSLPVAGLSPAAAFMPAGPCRQSRQSRSPPKDTENAVDITLEGDGLIKKLRSAVEILKKNGSPYGLIPGAFGEL